MCIITIKDLSYRNILIIKLLNERCIGTFTIDRNTILTSQFIQQRINKLETPDVRALNTHINDLKTLLSLVIKKENSWYIKIKNSLFKRC